MINNILILAKRLTEIQKNEITQLFISGINIEELSRQFNCTKLTISRNLRDNLGENNFKELSLKSKSNNKLKGNKNTIEMKIKTNDTNLKKNVVEKVDSRSTY